MKEKIGSLHFAWSRTFAAVMLVVVLGIGLGTAGCAGQPREAVSGSAAPASGDQAVEFPDFVYNSATSLAAYKLAPRLADVLSSLPCYCNCGRASQHRNLKDCYFKEDGSFNDHASNCDVCQDEVMDTDKWQREGKSLREIRAAIDEKYRDYGSPTDTPMVE